MQACRALSVLVLCLWSVGCTGEPKAEVFKTVSAGGTLTFKGKPLPGFLVSFQPTESSRTATGVTDSEGKFVLGTNAPGDGAVAGQHSVAVVWQPPVDDGMGDVIDDPAKLPKPPVNLPVNYASVKTSGIRVEIPEEGNTEIAVELE